MSIQSACCAPAIPVVATAELSRPRCPRCGSVLLFAKTSQFKPSGRIDHAWVCDDCGSEVVTSIDLGWALTPTLA